MNRHLTLNESQSTPLPFTAIEARKTLDAACRENGLHTENAKLIRLGENAIFQLSTEKIIIRIARSPEVFPDATKEVAVAEWLRESGLPAAEPAGYKQPLMARGKPVTFWCLIEDSRKKAILFNALDYAVELKLLGSNPIRGLKWKAPKSTHEVNRDCVVNPAQARWLLAAVAEQRRSGPRLVAFFAVLYFAGLRPEEAVDLRAANVILPALVWDEGAGRWRNLRTRGESCGSAPRRPTSARNGPTRAPSERDASSSTAPREKAVPCPARPSWCASYALT